jgi:hypothetical protein
MRMFNQVSTGLILTLCLTCRVVAATAVDTIRIDLNPLIDSAAHSQEQFAGAVRSQYSPRRLQRDSRQLEAKRRIEHMDIYGANSNGHSPCDPRVHDEFVSATKSELVAHAIDRQLKSPTCHNAATTRSLTAGVDIVLLDSRLDFGCRHQLGTLSTGA